MEVRFREARQAENSVGEIVDAFALEDASEAFPFPAGGHRSDRETVDWDQVLVKENASLAVLEIRGADESFVVAFAAASLVAFAAASPAFVAVSPAFAAASHCQAEELLLELLLLLVAIVLGFALAAHLQKMVLVVDLLQFADLLQFHCQFLLRAAALLHHSVLLCQCQSF